MVKSLCVSDVKVFFENKKLRKWKVVKALDSVEEEIRVLSSFDLVVEYIRVWWLFGESQLKLLVSPDLVELYILRHPLDSAEIELKLLSSPDLVKTYIQKRRFKSVEVELKLLSSLELVKLYIDCWDLEEETANKLFYLLEKKEKDKGGLVLNEGCFC